jgi:hypothetical protein
MCPGASRVATEAMSRQVWRGGHRVAMPASGAVVPQWQLGLGVYALYADPGPSGCQAS